VLTTFLYGDRSASLCGWIEQSLGRALLGVAFEEMPTAVRRGGEALRAVRLRVDRALATDLPSGLKAVAFFVRGTTALAGGDSAAALRDLSAALREGLSSPLRPLAENNLGVALARSGRGEEARARWMAARTATPSPPEASLNVGIFLDEQGGRGEEALAFFEEYLHSKGPRSSEVTAWADRLVRIFR
jgi:Flp pilus assembly protein TadD